MGVSLIFVWIDRPSAFSGAFWIHDTLSDGELSIGHCARRSWGVIHRGSDDSRGIRFAPDFDDSCLRGEIRAGHGMIGVVGGGGLADPVLWFGPLPSEKLCRTSLTTLAAGLEELPRPYGCESCPEIHELLQRCPIEPIQGAMTLRSVLGEGVNLFPIRSDLG